MSDRRAIVHPVKGRRPPRTGVTAIIVATETDFRRIGALASDAAIVEQRRLYLSRLQVRMVGRQRFTIVGPLIGAPAAAMVVETLRVWGVTSVVFVGWCGAVSREVKTGDIIVPDSAIVDEGTSGGYGESPVHRPTPHRPLAKRLLAALRRHARTALEGPVWTTDAIFRETVAKVRHYQQLGALAVEMEMSAIFSVAAFHQMNAAGILTVSDELSDYTWRPGFTQAAFTTACESACRTALDVVRAEAVGRKEGG
jgi:purine-nucleoside phosphorylase